jgi:membrane protease YdiL (CAAX protease family)
MSERIALARPLRREAAAVLVVVAGGAGLTLRAHMLELSGAGRVVGLAGLYVAILAVSVALPVAPGRCRLHPALVLGVGLAGIVVAASAGGRAVTIPFGPWALPLALLAAVAEEAMFRRVAFAALEPAGAALAVIATAGLFAAIHVPLYGAAAFPVDLGAGILLGWQRWAAGTWTVPAATHAAANLLAVIVR